MVLPRYFAFCPFQEMVGLNCAPPKARGAGKSKLCIVELAGADAVKRLKKTVTHY